MVSWLRELFVGVLGWQHGIEFVCLAFGKTEAAKIDGYTIHRWANLPLHDSYEATSRREAEYNERCLRCLSLRWMIIDEIDMVPAELFAELQKRIAECVLDTDVYRRPPDYSPRAFGGVNVLLRCAEFPGQPVAATSLFTRTSSKGRIRTDEGYRLIWSHDRDAVQRITQLTNYPAADSWSVQRLLRLAMSKESRVTCPMRGMTGYPQFAEVITEFLRWQPFVGGQTRNTRVTFTKVGRWA